ncbi:MAG: amidohydrolase, partial [Actinobacteria bacterium]|nr:amidohydrolase [Actinomycetota bacterium]
AAAAGGDGWLRGRGWRDGEWQEAPTAAALDAITRERPCALWARDTHSLWLNTRALELAGGDLDTPGGVVERDPAGAPSGVLRETAAWRFRDRFLVPREGELLEATREGIKAANARGVAAIHDKDGGAGAAAIFQWLRERDALPLRVWQSVPHDRLGDLVDLGIRSGLGDDFLRLGYLKVFLDGTLGSRTAAMLDGTGVTITSGDELGEIVAGAARAGWPVAVHAIGDRANRDALNAFERTRELWHGLGLRHRVEHAQCLAPEDVPRFARLGVACSVQFSHAPADRDLAEEAWPDRLDGAYAYRSLWESGALVVNGSDAPVEELDPLAGIRAAVLRTLDGRPAWRPEESLTVEQALVASTVNAAWLTGDERRRGRLLPGFLADLVVLDRDPLAIPPEELEAVSVVATMVGGRWVHNPPPWD